MPPTRLTIPDPVLVLLVGPSGAGKSTFAQAHFSPTEVISSDELRARVADDPADQDASAEAFRLLAIIANGRLKRRLTTVIDATNLRAVDRRRYRSLAVGHGVPVVAIAFDLPIETYVENNLGRPDRVVAAEVVSDQVARMSDALVDLPTEDYSAVHVLREPDAVEAIVLERKSE